MTWHKTNGYGICESTSPDLPEEFIYSLNSFLSHFFLACFIVLYLPICFFLYFVTKMMNLELA